MLAIQALESFVSRSPEAAQEHVPIIFELTLHSMSHDPNYADDMEDGEDEEAEEDDEYGHPPPPPPFHNNPQKRKTASSYADDTEESRDEEAEDGNDWHTFPPWGRAWHVVIHNTQFSLIFVVCTREEI
jgi:hypothetical protein